MCFNVGGYGALSIWTFVWAVLMVFINGMNALMPCQQVFEAWSIPQECTAMEADFLIQQSSQWISSFATLAVVAALKLEKMKMVKVITPFLIINIFTLMYFLVHGFGGHTFPPMALVLNGLIYGTFAVAFFVHKDHSGKSLF